MTVIKSVERKRGGGREGMSRKMAGNRISCRLTLIDHETRAIYTTITTWAMSILEHMIAYNLSSITMP